MNTFEQIHLWGPTFCSYLKELALEGERKEATIIGASGRDESNPAIRVATRYKIVDPAVLAQVREAFRANNQWGFDLHRGSEALPVVEALKYTSGGFYRSHTDWSPTYSERKLSMTVQLSPGDEYTGGAVKLFDGPEPLVASKEVGAALIWPAWTLHEVEPVKAGERWCLVAWMLGPRFV